MKQLEKYYIIDNIRYGDTDATEIYADSYKDAQQLAVATFNALSAHDRARRGLYMLVPADAYDTETGDIYGGFDVVEYVRIKEEQEKEWEQADAIENGWTW